ncbi:MAG TPA: hypothetical protein VIC62_23910 [Nakamurella sp.]
MAGDRRIGRIRRALVTALAAFAAAGIATLSVSCWADPASVISPASAGAVSSAVPAALPAADAEVAAIRATVDAFNAAAAGDPSDQRQRLLDLVDPDRREAVEQCAVATTTVRFEPVYAGLRMLRGPADTPATRPTYALPTLIRIYSDGRLTGTDLTTLQLVVNSATGGGPTEAYLTPFCVN